MITFFNMVTPDERGIKRLIGRLRGDKITVEVKRGAGVSVQEVTYISRSGRVCAERLVRATGGRRLLCCESVDFPKTNAFKRFDSGLFAARLCSNMALAALRECNAAAEASVCLYDPEAQSRGLAENLLKYTRSLCVVTDNPEAFYEQMSEAGERTGACAVVTRRREQAAACRLVLAPFRIDEPLGQICGDCVVLTGEKPSADVGGEVYFGYDFEMPECFKNIKPDYLGNLYFCSALYVLEGRHELGSVVPNLCMGDKTAHTVKSLAKEFERICGKISGLS